jgi:hypothetical protein
MWMTLALELVANNHIHEMLVGSIALKAPDSTLILSSKTDSGKQVAP